MKLGRGQILGLVFITISLALALAVYSRLPDPVPTHWNSRMQPNGFTPKPWGAFFPALVLAAVWLILLVFPRISPRGYRFESFARTWQVLQAAVMGLIFFLTSLSLIAAAGAHLALDRSVEAGLGVLLMIAGNFMGKLTKNFFVGIRTPWTIASDEVWLRTHRLGGKLLLIAGAMLFLCVVAGITPIPAFVAIATAALVPVVYSYVLYRRLEGFRERQAEDPAR